MEYALLRTLRALGPGLILLTYIDAFRLWVQGANAYFWSLDTAKLLLVGYIVGGAYGALTSHVNRETRAFSGVNESTLNALEEVVPGISQHSWRDISPCFYKFIDSDRSLEQKSKGVFFNGFIVTTAFESVWISYVASIVGLAAGIWCGSFYFLSLALAATVLSWLIWRASVKRHCELAQSQVNVIRKRFSAPFAECVIGQLSDCGDAG